MRFMFPESFNYAGNGSVLSIDTVKRVPLMSASLGKDDRGIFTVDTGSDARRLSAENLRRPEGARR